LRLIDTSIFIYATGREHPLRAACVGLVESLAVSPDDYAVDAEVLQELLHVYGGRGDRAKGAAAVHAVLTLFPEPLAIGGREMRLAAHLFAAQPRLSARDALHAAVALLYEVEAIVSADRDFDDVPGLRRIDPADITTLG